MSSYDKTTMNDLSCDGQAMGVLLDLNLRTSTRLYVDRKRDEICASQ
jgi:hypothetical protein